MYQDVPFEIRLIGDPRLRVKGNEFSGEYTNKAETRFAIGGNGLTNAIKVKYDRVVHWRSGAAVHMAGEAECTFLPPLYKPTLEVAVAAIEEMVQMLNEALVEIPEVKKYNLEPLKPQLNENTIKQIQRMLDDFTS